MQSGFSGMHVMKISLDEKQFRFEYFWTERILRFWELEMLSVASQVFENWKSSFWSDGF
jgi:hypothetical protein